MHSPARPRLLIIGAGDRGAGYAELARQFDGADIVGVAEPRAERRQLFAERFELPPEACSSDWRELLACDLGANAVVIATPDQDHVAPAVAAAALGFHILLEKPMAPDAEGCATIVSAVEAAGILFAVGHVLRYTAYTRRLKALLEEGVIGDIVSVQHLEAVGYWHMAHSFVRGNWRNEATSSFMLLAKSCHDLDWLRHIVGRPCRRASSFGSLHHFTAANRPASATERCTDCPLIDTCAYSAPRIYQRFVDKDVTDWPLQVLSTDTTQAGIDAALRDGPYGRCVYACDNDVVDHQVVSLEFEGGVSASFTMTAFATGGRTTRIFGTQGEIQGDGRRIKITDFRTDEVREIDTEAADSSRAGGHGGGDGGLFLAFCEAVQTGDAQHILSGPQETLESHQMVFAAEAARRTGQVVEM